MNFIKFIISNNLFKITIFIYNHFTIRSFESV
nr:MAG TPA: hypothetical protein [Caudoviricetes sp.]